jgi:rhodanese-related sulfurtransferase/predicted transcriptional regulator
MKSQEEEREVKAQLYEQFALIGKALGSARRLALIDLLAQSEYTVERLAEQSGMSVANTSQHLKTLRAARLVEVRRDGVVAHYRLADDAVFRTWRMIRELGETRIVEINWLAGRLFEDRDSLKLVSFAELLTLLQDGSATIVDVRPEREFQAGHIQGAYSIPLADLPARLNANDRDQEVVLYCRGPYSTLSDNAAAILQDEGFVVRRLELGFPEWRMRGLPIEVGPESVPIP